jgi:hypothetical protein
MTRLTVACLTMVSKFWETNSSLLGLVAPRHALQVAVAQTVPYIILTGGASNSVSSGDLNNTYTCISASSYN